MKKVNQINIDELTQMALAMYGNLVKAVVDISRNVLVIDAEMHADEEQFLLEDGSKQYDLWGINLYPAKFGSAEFIEFGSMINIRTRQQNMSREVEDAAVRQRIIDIVSKKVSA